ncbi:MAG TPA: hypothetical protein VGP72_10280 [Planctomycetota bacterium]|jgi:hypothetical protein
MTAKLAVLVALCLTYAQAAESEGAVNSANQRLDWLTLEVSLKPFKDNSEDGLRRVSREMFRQWSPLARHAQGLQVLLWTADGSELFEYSGDMSQEFEWAKFIGIANKTHPVSGDKEGIALHSRSYLYTENPARWTYKRLKQLVRVLKEEGEKATGLPVRVGATVDPGPEFAISKFKYERHREICQAGTMGNKSFVCCYATLKADSQRYAGFPDGIPEGLPFGAFLGRQARHFLKDMGFDYLWLSNGLGFGMETWAYRGAIFDGQRFYPEKCKDVRERILGFWQAFRKECPDIRVETRGTNLSTGRDLSADAVPLSELYHGGFNFVPPPNSPWAALNGDFGLEITGWMSHIADLPGEVFPYRFYTHDPWWKNSPWLDRYGRQPHDIYLPLAVARINAAGEVKTPAAYELLTVDDSFGTMPEEVPNEVIPHLLMARSHRPDQAGPLIWVYPFDEYHRITFQQPERLSEVFFGDWFIRGAFNHGLPLNTVVTTTTMNKLLREQPAKYRETILVTAVPEADSPWEQTCIAHLRQGGHALFYGPVQAASSAFRELLGLDLAAPLSGEGEAQVNGATDFFSSKALPKRFVHSALLSTGGVETVVRPGSGAEILAQMKCTAGPASSGTQSRVLAVYCAPPQWNGGAAAWVRGSICCSEKSTSHLLEPLDAQQFFHAELLMRYALARMGYELLVTTAQPREKSPATVVARHANGFFFSGYVPNTLVAPLHFRFPQGAPLLIGAETQLVDGRTTYNMPRAWHRECRVFIEQKEGEVSCVEFTAEDMRYQRRLRVSGLQNARLRFYPDPERAGKATILRNPRWPFIEGEFLNLQREENGQGVRLRADDVTGTVLISW